jgi:hypothetical protein
LRHSRLKSHLKPFDEPVGRFQATDFSVVEPNPAFSKERKAGRRTTSAIIIRASPADSVQHMSETSL